MFLEDCRPLCKAVLDLTVRAASLPVGQVWGSKREPERLPAVLKPRGKRSCLETYYCHMETRQSDWTRSWHARPGGSPPKLRERCWRRVASVPAPSLPGLELAQPRGAVSTRARAALQAPRGRGSAIGVPNSQAAPCNLSSQWGRGGRRRRELGRNEVTVLPTPSPKTRESPQLTSSRLARGLCGKSSPGPGHFDRGR